MPVEVLYTTGTHKVNTFTTHTKNCPRGKQSTSVRTLAEDQHDEVASTQHTTNTALLAPMLHLSIFAFEWRFSPSSESKLRNYLTIFTPRNPEGHSLFLQLMLFFGHVINSWSYVVATAWRGCRTEWRALVAIPTAGGLFSIHWRCKKQWIFFGLSPLGGGGVAGDGDRLIRADAHQT